MIASWKEGQVADVILDYPKNNPNQKLGEETNEEVIDCSNKSDADNGK